MDFRLMYAVVWKPLPDDSCDVLRYTDVIDFNQKAFLGNHSDCYSILCIVDSEDIARHKLQELIDMK